MVQRTQPTLVGKQDGSTNLQLQMQEIAKFQADQNAERRMLVTIWLSPFSLFIQRPSLWNGVTHNVLSSFLGYSSQETAIVCLLGDSKSNHTHNETRASQSFMTKSLANSGSGHFVYK